MNKDFRNSTRTSKDDVANDLSLGQVYNYDDTFPEEGRDNSANDINVNK